MAALTALTSTTVEGGLLELIEEIGDLQAASALTDTPKTIIDSYARDGVTGLITVSLTLPSTSAEGVDGKPVLTATTVFA